MKTVDIELLENIAVQDGDSSTNKASTIDFRMCYASITLVVNYSLS